MSSASADIPRTILKPHPKRTKSSQLSSSATKLASQHAKTLSTLHKRRFSISDGSSSMISSPNSSSYARSPGVSPKARCQGHFPPSIHLHHRLTKARLLIGYRDPARAVTLHTCISSFPSEIPAPGLAKTIEIVTKSVPEVFLIFLDIITAFSSHETNNTRERVAARKSNEMMKRFYTGKEAEWEALRHPNL